mgnify:CR=1 FL=1
MGFIGGCAIYLGQAVGTTVGGAVIASVGYRWLPLVGAVVLAGAWAVMAFLVIIEQGRGNAFIYFAF